MHPIFVIVQNGINGIDILLKLSIELIVFQKRIFGGQQLKAAGQQSKIIADFMTEPGMAVVCFRYFH